MSLASAVWPPQRGPRTLPVCAAPLCGRPRDPLPSTAGPHSLQVWTDPLATSLCNLPYRHSGFPLSEGTDTPHTCRGKKGQRPPTEDWWINRRSHGNRKGRGPRGKPDGPGGRPAFLPLCGGCRGSPVGRATPEWALCFRPDNGSFLPSVPKQAPPE